MYKKFHPNKKGIQTNPGPGNAQVTYVKASALPRRIEDRRPCGCSAQNDRRGARIQGKRGLNLCNQNWGGIKGGGKGGGGVSRKKK